MLRLGGLKRRHQFGRRGIPFPLLETQLKAVRPTSLVIPAIPLVLQMVVFHHAILTRHVAEYRGASRLHGRRQSGGKEQAAH